MNPRLLVSIIALLALSPAVRADVKLPPVFSDHMVLQADFNVPVFGSAELGEQITVEFNGQKKTATTGKDGKWLARLDPLKAGGPFELKIAGKNTLVLKDVLVGEVWVAAGQSNMRFSLANATNGKDDASSANHPNLRFLRVGGKWQTCTP